MFSQKAAPAQPVLPALQHTVSGCQTLHADSRKIQPGDVFIACQGEYADGRDYIADAIANGASFVYWDDDGAFKWQPEWQVPNQAISDLKQRAGMLAAQAYDNLSGCLNAIGVTGTNGKTSITQWLAQAIDDLEHAPSCAIIGTVGNGFFGKLQATTHTTPNPVAVQTLIHQFKQQGAKHIAMEVSSHGLAQYRVNGVPFQTAVFTNLTRDHLDYHGSMAEYGAIKARLFYWQGLQNAIINSDDAFGAALAAELKQHSGSLKTEGCNEVKTIACMAINKIHNQTFIQTAFQAASCPARWYNRFRFGKTYFQAASAFFSARKGTHHETPLHPIAHFPARIASLACL